MSATIALVEREHGEPQESSLEALALGREIAEATDGPLEAVVFGDEGAAVADQLGTHGVERIHHAVGEDFAGYAPHAWGEALAQVAAEGGAEAVVAPGSDRSQEVLAHAGATLDLPMAANVTAVDAGDVGEASDAGDPGGAYEVTRQRWGGSLTEVATLAAETKLLSAAEHEFPIEPAPEATDPSVEEFAPDVEEAARRVAVERVEESDVEGVPLGEARVVVSGGRGVGNAEDFDQLEELADLLGGTVGASRAAVNEGWRPHDDQVGLTGAKISPDIYIACGISGAVQHMVGCKGAENILAINTDPNAAIVQQGEYAVIGDLHEVVPALNEAIRAEE